MAGRNVVVCCDGTANEFAENRTNVIKLYSVLDHNPVKQIAYYHPGLGTMEPAGALTNFSRKVTKLFGSRYAMEHLNRRGQNIHCSFALTILHFHERWRSPDGRMRTAALAPVTSTSL
jgi:uncharacterized protein (DUF2235 family)